MSGVNSSWEWISIIGFADTDYMILYSLIIIIICLDLHKAKFTNFIKFKTQK